MDIPGPARYFEEPREASNDHSMDELRSLHKTASRAVMHSVIEKNKYSSLEQSASQVSLAAGLRSPTSQTKDTRFEKDSTRSVRVAVAQSVNLK